MPTNRRNADLVVVPKRAPARALRPSSVTLLLLAAAGACDSPGPAGPVAGTGGDPALHGTPTGGTMGAGVPAGGGSGVAGLAAGAGAAPAVSGTGAVPAEPSIDAGSGDAELPDAALPADAATSTPDAAPQGDSTGRTLVPDPGWSCGMQDGLPPPEEGTLVLELEAKLGAVLEVGQTPFGARVLAELGQGSVSGPEIEGTLLAGGLDWQVTLDNGVVEVEQTILIRTSDRQTIYLRNCGVAAPGDRVVRIAPDFEAATTGGYAWLGDGVLVGTRELDAAAKTLTMRIYDVAAVAVGSGADAIRVARPSGTPGQSWECQPAMGSQGSVAFTETVGIGASVSVGTGKRGARSAIPITGGSVTGRVEGAVRAGGADYQLVSGGFILDARYTLETDDGEIILVRNCGPASSLLPTFETRSDGPYDWLNSGRWLSSSPGLAAGAVRITIYETR